MASDRDVDTFEECVRSAVAAAERAAALAKDPAAERPPPGVPSVPADSRAGVLARALELDAAELDFVWSVVARAVEPRFGGYLRSVFGNDARIGVSLGQHAAIRELPAERCRALLRVLDVRHPLRSHGVLEIADDAPLDVAARWTAPPRTWGYLRGEDELDPAIALYGVVVEPPFRALLSPAQQEAHDKLAAWLVAPDAPTILLEGAPGSGRRTCAALAAAPRPVVALDLARVGVREATASLVALRREATLLGAIPVVANLDELWSQLAPGDDALRTIAAALDRMTGPVVVTTATPGLDLRAASRSILRATWPVPDVSTRRALWQAAVSDALADTDLDLVGQRYELGAGGIQTAARSAAHHAAQRGASLPALADVVTGVQDNIAERLGELARRVVVTQSWSELVLPPETLDDVRALIGRIRHAHLVLHDWGFRKKLARGTGVAALFSGPPGTGKTMVAGLIARELQLELYQVDLSRIVSKWVGETEKQLAKVFEAAEAGHALLLFDEADALFAKRSADVKSAVDRYANLEVNYLLQRVESFGGVVILTTNLDTSIDPALRRRLASHVVFTAPEAEERARLWRDMLDTGAPLGEAIDYDELAEEFSAMTGANIRNAVLAAAFLAAEHRTLIDRDLLRRAGRGEYRSMGHVLGKDHGMPRGL
ncbi:MAG TPA: ATP-binding protein [Kofleriaceae bacterium]|nr:ATP-binding protein [Kofleriaceae bacterium]